MSHKANVDGPHEDISFVLNQRRRAGELEEEMKRRDTKRGHERGGVSYEFLHPSVSRRLHQETT